MNNKRPTMLMILDGFGLNPSAYGNAVAAARTPNLDAIFAKYPHIKLAASGLAVGLPEGQMGNSEVGHLNIGAGRIVYQELTRITKAIEDEIFFDNLPLNHAVRHVKETGGTLHVFGLLSDGGVHSHISHIEAVLKLAKMRGLQKVVVHCFMDGRDVPPTSGLGFVRELEAYLARLGLGKIGVVSGRYYAMDRDKRWDRVQLAYDALTLGSGRKAASAEAAVQAAYDAGETDEFIKPTLCCASDSTAGDAAPKTLRAESIQPSVQTAADKSGISPNFAPANAAETAEERAAAALTVQDGDSIIFCNFRPDRARELTRAFVDPDFDGFSRRKQIKNLTYVCMTQYDATIPNVEVAFPPQVITNTLGEYLSKLGLHQLRIAETEKYAHVTFFFNGGVEQPNPLEDRVLIPSPKVATYDLQPEMSAPEVTAQVIKEIASSKYDVIILNFANADMVGHTGVFEAAVKAIETLDGCVQQIVNAVLNAGGQILLTADHGNADEMLDADGHVVTAHSTNPVPLVHISAEPAVFGKDSGKLADIAPTLLHLLDLPVPPEMTGDCLVK